jgi:hypothetical protein
MKQVLLVLGIILGLIVIAISTILGGLYFNGTLWISAGVGIILISFSLYKYLSSREAAELARGEQERLAKLMNDGVRVIVDLSKCEMKSSSYHMENKGLDYLNEMEAVDIIFDSGEKEQQTTIHTVLVYKHRLQSGKMFKFYGPTSKDKRTLEILCTMKKQTTLYFDRNDPEVYYFDLRFLD